MPLIAPLVLLKGCSVQELQQQAAVTALPACSACSARAVPLLAMWLGVPSPAPAEPQLNLVELCLCRRPCRARGVEVPRLVRTAVTLAVLLATAHCTFWAPPIRDGIIVVAVAGVRANGALAAKALGLQ